jgi:hypothetical protein
LTAARAFVLPVKEETTLLRYRLQARHYDLFQRTKKNPDKLSSGQSDKAEIFDTAAEEELGKGRKKGRKRKTFGLIQDRAFPKVAKAALERETNQLSELPEDADHATATECFLTCATVIQRTLTVESASSLMSFCPVFFSNVSFLQKHVSHLTDGNDIFVNSMDHFEFQMELIFQYLTTKIPQKEVAKVCCHD